MSVSNIGNSSSVNKINMQVSRNEKPVVVKADPTPSLPTDSLSTSTINAKKKLPTIKFFIDPSKKEIKVASSDYQKFNNLYNNINKGLIERITGDEATSAIEILSNDKLRKFASDAQKTTLIKVISFHVESFQKSDPATYKKAIEAVNKTINDFKSSGRMDHLMEEIFIDMANTGAMAANLDDWAARKVVSNDELLKASTPEQKVVLLYSLKLGYTEKSEEIAINKVIKNAVEQGQLKDIMGIWSDGLDIASASFDTLYTNLSDDERVVFLETFKAGMKKENISPDVIKELYGGKKILEALPILAKAKILESQYKYVEASNEYAKIGIDSKAKEMLEYQGYKNYNEGNYLALLHNFALHYKYDAKNLVNKTADMTLREKGGSLIKSVSSFMGERMDTALKNFPILQSKSVYELKEKRRVQLLKLANIPTYKPNPTQQAIDNKKFEAKIDKLTGTKARENNAVSIFVDGEAAYNKLKSGIENAKESIYMEAFIYRNDEKGNEIADKLIEKAKKGLDVRVIVDSFTNAKEFPVYDKMRKNGVKVIKSKGSFDNPIESRGLSAYHRKLYVFDKKEALTGGINIGNEYLNKGKWHDLLVEAKGPVMSDILNDFYKHWSFSSDDPKDKLEKAPPPEAFKLTSKTNTENFETSNSKVRLLTTDPNEKNKGIKIWMLEAISHAKERVLVQDPYFNDPEIINALKEAVNRGVKVEVIFPDSNDVKIMKHLDENTLDELYAEGADTYKYNTNGKESFNHLKVTVVDDMVCLGSANRDVRAMNTNQEINYVIDDPKFTKEFMDKVWVKDKEKSTFAEPVPENFVKRIIKLGFKQFPSLF